ncbi:dsRBD fold-containing protein [Nonomuraea turcica]|uniref:dsRBD fold-containing protein n=1 Tax=Nonomuraea sp. G32 TaxID=3067274 RepID=UPI00273CEBBC|nr:dsRBD fold-containing protein [Nonomuraea sp. G32]MDP4503257.1 DUF1876 family protein [Nonomuraea sp. G32]
MESKRWSVEIDITEEGAETTARATLTGGGAHLAGIGQARRHPADPPMAEIGDELAVSRALNDLAQKLAVISRHDIERFVDTHVPTWSW